MSTQTTERWLPVPGWEGAYEVSDLARVRSLPRGGRGGVVLKLSARRDGHPQVNLYRAGRGRHCLVRSLVAAAFIGPVGPGVKLRPLNGDPGDASLANLEIGGAAWTRRPPALPAADPDTALPPDILDRHLRHLRQLGHTEGTVEARRRALTRMASRLPVPLLAASAEDLGTWREGLAVTASTVRGYCSHAKSFYDWAVDQGLADRNPAARLPVPRKARRLPRPIAEKDLMTALGCAPARIRLWLILAAWTGLRAREIAYLRRESVLLSASPPVLVVTLEAAKGGRVERAVPLCEFVVGELQAAGLPMNGWIFRRLDGAPGPNMPHTISHLANAYLHDCGIASTLHSLRHFFGTMTYRASHDLLAVQAMMGHADPATTAGYAEYEQQSAVDAVAAIPVPPRAARKAS